MLKCRCGHPDDVHGMWGCMHPGCACGRFEGRLNGYGHTILFGDGGWTVVHIHPADEDEKERLAIRTAAFDWIICTELERALDNPFEEDESYGGGGAK